MRTNRVGTLARPVRRRRLQALATCVAAGALAVGLAAAPSSAASRLLVSQKHGSDIGNLRYFGSYTSRGEVRICDNEADGRGVYIQLQNEAGESLSWTDEGGSDGVCEDSSSYFAINFIEWMRVCERINNWPDDCTDKISIRYGD
ncbi:hypothetical protein O7599_20205 [Streptomyces sp. WMMC500]|uniref:hypothetical protein n=1 Tax=Streptomyces sp. WMMC500 TaxID=3015154 RepID=UPI00248BB25F|nr:hypothetical protein [Streptomyces sp. WMMC500]WBB57989.1 hypothetical protein O7599_20205 [Streptomyces sp. WMMC500]